jgi:hypothetical protein
MIVRMKFLLLLFLIIKLDCVFAQTEPAFANKAESVKQIRDFLAGFWQEDSTLAIVEFQAGIYELRLNRPGFYSYEFFSVKSFPLNGGTISWPPHDCTVTKLNDGSIEIRYTLFGDKTGRPLRYKKINSL